MASFGCALGDHYRILSWDYRGLYGSELKGDQRDAVSLDVDAHAADAEAVLAHAGVDRAVLVGWSMGVQLILNSPVDDRGSRGPSSRCLVVMDRPCLEPSRGLGERAIRPGLDVFRGSWTPSVLDLDVVVVGSFTAQTLRLVHPNVDVEVFNDLLVDYMNLDFEAYTQILAALSDHNAEAVLPTLQCPVLIIAGDRDPMTPDSLSSYMARTIRPELMVVLGTHYVPVEFQKRSINGYDLPQRKARLLRHRLRAFSRGPVLAARSAAKEVQ